MTKKQAKQIFDKYNPQDAVTRCPNGRAPFRKMLDTYARAAVNLYGIIPIKDFVEIVNSQNIEHTNADEVYTLLLPDVLKKNKLPSGVLYCFYKDCITHYWAMDNFDLGDFWLREQGDKPRFIPGKNEFTKYEDEYYEDEVQKLHWKKVLDFLLDNWSTPNIYKFYNELKDISQFFGQMEISELLREYDLPFSSEKQIQAFFDLLHNAHNNTRMWMNKGYSPKELREISKLQHQEKGHDQIVIQERKKIGANEPCPCGSGKKYKKCCRIIDEAMTAQLNWSECTLFYETWYGLMGFINEKKNILAAQIKPIYPNPINDELIYKVREALWENPELINDYLVALEAGVAGSVNQQEEKAELLKSWRDRHIKGMFLIVDYKPEYAVVMGFNEKQGDILYAIKGITRSIADVLQHELPVQIETVLLPFKDKIIYDCFLSSMNLSFGKTIRGMFSETYKKAMKNGIIISL